MFITSLTATDVAALTPIKMNQYYELALIVSPDLTNPEIEKKLQSIRQSLDKVGQIKSEDIWGMRSLAYVIKHHDRGFYAIFYVEAPAGALAEINNDLRLDSGILRYIIINHDQKYTPIVRLDEEDATLTNIKKTPHGAKEVKPEIISEPKEEKKPEKIKKESQAAPDNKKIAKDKPEPEVIEKDDSPEEKQPAPEATTEIEAKIEKEEKEIAPLEIPEPEKDEPAKKKAEEKKKSSLDDLDSALDRLLQE